ncbi:MAG: AI-2E family transporter [Alphaproteobacteria bacterium]
MTQSLAGAVTWRTVLIASLSLLALAVLVMALEVVFVIFTGVVMGVSLAHGSAALSARLGAPRSVCLAFLVAVTGLAVIGFAVTAGPQIAEQLQVLIKGLPEFLGEARTRVEMTGVGADVIGVLETAIADLRSGSGGQPFMEQGASLLRGVAGVFSTTFGVLTGIFIVVAISLYISIEPNLYRSGVLALVPPARRTDASELMDRISSVLAWWVAGQALSMLVLGTLMTVGLWIVGVPFALVFGVFTALMTFVPNLGPVIAAVPVLLVALTQGVDVALYAFVLIIIVQNVEGLILTPMVHRRIIALPPALVLAALLLLATVAGFIGVLVAMPLTAVGQTVARFLVEKRDAAQGA